MSTSTARRSPRTWNIILWIAQIILAGMFLMGGLMKMISRIADLTETLPWVADFPSGVVRFIGVSEFLGGLGLILPGLLRIKPVLTGYAALGIVAIMLLAMTYHLSKGEANAILFNLLLGGVAAFIAWGRLKKAPFQRRAR